MHASVFSQLGTPGGLPTCPGTSTDTVTEGQEACVTPALVCGVGAQFQDHRIAAADGQQSAPVAVRDSWVPPAAGEAVISQQLAARLGL